MFFGVFVALSIALGTATATTTATATCDMKNGGSCTETEAQCVVRLKRTKPLREAQQQCCTYAKVRNGVEELQARQECCMSTLQTFQPDLSSACVFEICFFEKVEDEVTKMRQAFVYSELWNGFMVADAFVVTTANFDGVMSKMMEAENDIQAKNYNVTRQLLGDIPYNKFAQTAATDFLAQLEALVLKADSDPEVVRSTLKQKLEVLFVQLEGIGVKYDTVTEMVHRQARYAEWDATLQSTIQIHTMPPVAVDPKLLPLVSSLDFFGERQTKRAAVNARNNQSRSVRKMCRSADDRPTQASLEYVPAAWTIAQEKWKTQELEPWMRRLQAWRQNHVHDLEKIKAKVKCLGAVAKSGTGNC